MKIDFVFYPFCLTPNDDIFKHKIKIDSVFYPFLLTLNDDFDEYDNSNNIQVSIKIWKKVI